MKGIVCPTWKGRKPTEAEIELGKWAEKRGLFVWLDQDDEGNPTCDLAIEEMVQGRMLFSCLAMPTRGAIWPEALDHLEKLLRIRFADLKEEDARFKWWEHVSR